LQGVALTGKEKDLVEREDQGKAASSDSAPQG